MAAKSGTSLRWTTTARDADCSDKVCIAPCAFNLMNNDRYIASP